MVIELYYKSGSPPCHAALLTAKSLNLDVNLILINLAKREHKSSQYLKINPHSKVPALVDDGFIVCESRAIMMYLVDKYGGENNALYPKEPQARAMVNSRLFFDIGSLYTNFNDYYFSVLFFGQPVNQNNYDKLKNSLLVLETFLKGEHWVAGLHMTIADISLVVVVATIASVEIFDLQADYPDIFRWYNNAKKQIVGYEEIVEQGFKDFEIVVRKVFRNTNPFFDNV